jgi:hypothetical protein
MGGDYKGEEALTFCGTRGAKSPTGGIDEGASQGQSQAKLQS